MGKERTGAKGDGVVIKVPVGTQILDDDRETQIADLTRPGERLLLLAGGDGGFGNIHFKTSTNQAPRRAVDGHPGDERWLWLRLKLIADVGLIGLPNAGKSTFLSAVSRAHPKIADYPFTTLHPNLGVAFVDGDEVVLADIPGLIEGAHAGAGLGTRFLGHVERCAVLLHLVDGTGEDAAAAYRTVRGELEAYGAGLAQKPALVALNKCDALTPEDALQKKRALAKAIDCDVETISGVAGIGVPEMMRALVAARRQSRADEEASAQSLAADE